MSIKIEISFSENKYCFTLSPDDETEIKWNLALIKLIMEKHHEKVNQRKNVEFNQSTSEFDSQKNEMD